ncbi:MAG: MFS transporter [Acidimicrobiia bacterium]
MRSRMPLAVTAPPAEVATAASDVLGVTAGPEGLSGPLASVYDPTARLRVEMPTQPGAPVVLEATTELRVPYFRWFLVPVLYISRRRDLRHAVARLRARLANAPEPPPPRRLPLLPPVPFSPEQASQIATVAFAAAVANFGASLFGLNADPVTDAFGATNRDLGVALAVTRLGVLVALVSTALADRRGRRNVILAAFIGVCAANLLSAVAPGLIVFTGAQAFTRAFVQVSLIVAGIAVIEEAPEGARAYALSMFALAAGAGFALAVLLLPLADLDEQAWRISFGVSALMLVFLPGLRRRMRETGRYEAVAARKRRRGRISDIVDLSYRGRFILLALTAFLLSVLSAPSSQLTNRYLTDEQDFSNLAIAVFRTVTAGLPGLLAVVVAGWLAERRGRRPLAVVALALGSLLQMTFFLGSGSVLWISATAGIFTAACSGIAIGALDVELFPTEVRGTSNGLVLFSGVIGSTVGLLLATNLDGPLGGLGPAIAVCAIAPLLAALFVVPFLPEAAHRRLDDVSPSEL